MSARTSAAAALALGLGLACVRPAARPAPVAREAASTLPAPVLAAGRPATRRAASGPVSVLLSALAGSDALTVHDPARGELAFVRTADGVRCGVRTRETWSLARSPGSSGLRVGGRTYAGRLAIRAAPAGGLEVINRVDLEDYVAGVVASELAVWSAPPALLEAQAIAARSYAVAELDHRGRSTREPYLVDDTRDQAYVGGEPEDPGERTRAALERVARAVERTRAQVLVEGEAVLDARFHAACGGTTAAGASVFPEADFASLAATPCEPCRAPGVEAWKLTATRAELDRLARELGAGAPLRTLEPVRRDGAGRWLEVAVRGSRRRVETDFGRLRRILGERRLPGSMVLSTWPRPGEPIPAGLAFVGRGRGHGVGMCQLGARGYAERGWSAARILSHYYPGAQVRARP